MRARHMGGTGYTERVRRACAALAAVAALAGVAACDGSGDAARGENGNGRSERGGISSVSLAALQEVESRTREAESAKVVGSVTMGSMSMTMDGAIDWSDGMIGALAMKQKGAAVDQLGGDGTMRARYLPDAMYVNMGPGFAQETKGKSWLKYDYDDLSDLSGASGDVLRDQLQNNNPTKSVQMLLASGDVKEVGTETVQGQQTTRYSGTVDIADFTERSSKALSDEQLEEFRSQLEQSGLTSERIDLWVNDDDLLVKKTESATTSQGDFRSTVIYSDYGTEVSVQEPAASDTVDFLELLEERQGR